MSIDALRFVVLLASASPESLEASTPMFPQPEPPPAAYRAPRRDFLHRGGFLRPSLGFSMCTSELCDEIPTGWGGSLSGGYRFPYVGVGALVIGSGGETRRPSSLRGPLERVGMSFLFVGAMAQFTPVQTGRFSPSLDVAFGYLRLMEWGRIDGENIFALYSRLAVAVGGTLDIHVSRRVAIGPSFHYLFPLSGQQCNDIAYDVEGNYREAEGRDCSDYRYREDGWDGPERRALRRDTTRAWLASVGVTVHLGEPRGRSSR